METSTKQGYIIIRHALLTTITEEQAISAIEKANPAVERSTFQSVKIGSVTEGVISHGALSQLHWQLEANHHKKIVEGELYPLMEKYPDYKIVYFGAAPVALATFLGSLIGTWKAVEIFLQHHHGEKDWYQLLPTSEEGNKETDLPKIVSTGVPKEENKTLDDISIAITTSYSIEQKELEESIGSHLAKEITLSLEPLTMDVPEVALLGGMADEFGDILHQVTNNLKYIDTIHLVAAVPVGLAFLLGTKVSANVHRSIQLYQYDKNTTPVYTPVLKLGEALEVPFVLTEEQQQMVAAQKQQFQQKDWKEIQSFIKDQGRNHKKAQSWLDDFYNLKEGAAIKKAFGYSFWNDLPAIHQTPLQESKFSLEEPKKELFDYDRIQETWLLDNILWYKINNQLAQEGEKNNRAIRLLLFHEGMHYWKHNLKGSTTQGIGRFPKILEKADYQSDVWAMWYEYAYSERYDIDTVEKGDASTFFIRTIDYALATMWAFDDQGANLDDMQIRRVNRYLIWYWQRLRLAEKKCKDLGDVASVLSEMPTIELKGLYAKTEGHRLFYRFDKMDDDELELGVLWSNKIVRIGGNVGNFSIKQLIQAFKERDSTAILESLQSAYDFITS